MKTFEAEFLFNFLFLPLIIKNTIYFETKIEIKDSNCSTFSKEIELLKVPLLQVYGILNLKLYKVDF